MSYSAQPVMWPAPGDRLQHYVGDSRRFTVRDLAEGRLASGWRALLRTNLGRAQQLRREIVESHTRGLSAAGASWRDIPMVPNGAGWEVELPLAETGYFRAKAYLVDPGGWQHWPAGPDVGISVHPDFCRTANTIYCAFPRLFGETRVATAALPDPNLTAISGLEKQGYTVLPESGRLRDLIQVLPHITESLGCRILHLLPINPTPTTYARFGRFGSPYAALDLTGIDPALVMFDKRTTGVDQFRELAFAVHGRGARLILDIAINHTGWGSVLQERRPEWFLHKASGEFASPGAWGVTWEDLVELKHDNVELWDEFSEIFLTWCRRGVDGFRCDAGYMVPVPAWQYIVARVQTEYPDTIFLLEGLGGAWEATSALLGEGGMQWAYSELFQNYSPQHVAGYLDHHFRQAERTGLLVHYSETHDNERLAKKGRVWSLLRNRLCALASTSGGFGFTCGVEWLAAEKIRVHERTGLGWGQAENLVPELSTLNRLLASHPAFFDGAEVTRVSPDTAGLLALYRVSAERKDAVLVLVNTDTEHAQTLELEPGHAGWPQSARGIALESWVDLLGQDFTPPQIHGGHYTFKLQPGQAVCLAPAGGIVGLGGETYRDRRALAAWAMTVLHAAGLAETACTPDWRRLAALVATGPGAFLSGVAALARGCGGDKRDFPALEQLCGQTAGGEIFSSVVPWTLVDRRRVTPVPPDHWLLIEDTARFRAALTPAGGVPTRNVESVLLKGKHYACFPPTRPGAAELLLERYAASEAQVQATLQFLESTPDDALLQSGADGGWPERSGLVLLTNGRGSMCRMCVDLGAVTSKYDCVLGANLHPSLPVDRHVLAKRLRAWVSADGFISALDHGNLVSFQAGPPAVWDFVAHAGGGRTVQVRLEADMVEGGNTVRFVWCRPTAERAIGKQLPEAADVRLTVRVDIEDRSYHGETKRNGAADHHFNSHTRALAVGGSDGHARVGFEFTPTPERRLYVVADAGVYHPKPEWSHNIPHPVETSRGQIDAGDAYSPGWFEIPLKKGGRVELLVSADAPDRLPPEAVFSASRICAGSATVDGNDLFGTSLLRATRAFVVKRGEGKTVIAGYPWFLDWGRDTFIAARGLLAAGMLDEVRQMAMTFARFVDRGTLPNTIFGEDASNRDTSDAPLWFGVVCEELAESLGPDLYRVEVARGLTLESALRNIAIHYASGTPNGIRIDTDSGLIWSPSHFTWMDTNYPAGTPREGYPVEIQGLWWRLLRHIARLGHKSGEANWEDLSARVAESLRRRYWSDKHGYYADLLVSPPGEPARSATPDFALRSNYLFLVSLGVVTGASARQSVEAARRHLVVPGGLRTLAPLPVRVPVPIYHHHELLNNPLEPYWGRYEGDEDTRRKPAYHNGTAWTWTLPVFCEALARAWDFSAPAVNAARSYLAGMAPLLRTGCLGHLPEVMDGDAPHRQRGCDAQAWSATEALRVWKLLQRRLGH